MKSSNSLAERAREARIHLLSLIYHAGSGHPGGSLSAVDLLSYLYFARMEISAEQSPAKDRDRFILSKGHACPALYAVGYLKGLVKRSDMGSLRKLNGVLQGHPHVGTMPWVETSTGSLGQGFSVALGMAWGLRHQGMGANVYVMLGDGELQEGEVWEGAMFAAHHRLSRICAILDYNKMQSDDLNANIMGLEPLADKWRAFGWRVVEMDGHDFDAMADAFAVFDDETERPTLILAHTIKGKGVSYMEGVPSWHGSVKLTDQNLTRALAELDVSESQWPGHLNGSIWEAHS